MDKISEQLGKNMKRIRAKKKMSQGDIARALEVDRGYISNNVILFKSDPNSSLKEILLNSLGALVVVDKQREIYFIENVKFHIDTVKNLGTFMEIEAMDSDSSFGKEKLLEQCENYLQLFGIPKSDFISVSYSDLLLQKL